jgi:UDP-glucose 4-epimerase
MAGHAVLVSGAAGFVGANLVRRLLDDAHSVTALMAPGSDPWRLAAVARDVHTVECDLRDREDVARACREAQPAWVFHLAAHGAYSWQDDAARILETNVLGTVALAEATLEAEAFVHAGSSSEYGPKDHPAREDEVLEPDSHYAVGKAAATLWLRQLPRGVTLRFYSVYGPWEEPKRLVPTLVGHALRGELPPLVDPDIARDFVYVDDVCDALLAAVDAEDGAVFNVATGRQTTLRELVDLVREQFDVTAEPQWGSMDARSWDTTTWVGDPSAIAEQLGWRARTSLADGLAATARWLEEGELPAERTP